MAATIALPSPTTPFRRLLPALVARSGPMACWPSIDEWPSRADEPDRAGGCQRDLPLSGLDALQAHVLTFLTAHTFAKHPKALQWRAPFPSVCHAWKADASIFKIDPHHLITRPYI